MKKQLKYIQRQHGWCQYSSLSGTEAMTEKIFKNLNLKRKYEFSPDGEMFHSVNPSSGEWMSKMWGHSEAEYNSKVDDILHAQKEWRKVPAPKRGEVVRQMGNAFREHKEDLGNLISLEVGKIKSEGLGEVQEAIDICDLAVGWSRKLEGKILPSERPQHNMYEVYNPLGTIGVISAFNFPIAVSLWNQSLALIGGNACLWKGAPSTNLCTIATAQIMQEVLKDNGYPEVLSDFVVGGADIGQLMAEDERLPMISFTGSTKVGKHVNQVVHDRWGKSLLELGGNNAVVVHKDADLDLAKRAIVFAAVGTAGQRCTSNRRVIVHEDVKDELVQSLKEIYATIKIGNPIEDPDVLCGPLHNEAGVEKYARAVDLAKEQGGKLVFGGATLDGNFVEPTIFEIDGQAPIVQEETFAPILYIMTYKEMDEAIAMNNQVSHGLSSALFSKDIEFIFKWMGPDGSDCGIVNTNIGTSGAEIGGLFGGEKQTGGGRECTPYPYMRVSTCSINFGKELPLAQGVKFV